MDGCEDGKMVWAAYNAAEGQTDKFVRNTFDYASEILGKDVFQQDDRVRIGRWNVRLGRHEQYLVPRKDLWLEDGCFEAGEKTFVVASHKYNQRNRGEYWRGACLDMLDGWEDARTDYGKRRAMAPVSVPDPDSGLYFLSARGTSSM